jgi:Bacterial antitoxin of ParD toxin-antitoxin type II system and RHH
VARAVRTTLVRDGLRLLEDQEAIRHAKLQRLRVDIQAGLNSGPSTPLDMKAVRAEGKRLRTRTCPRRHRKKMMSCGSISDLAFVDLAEIYLPFSEGIDVVRVLHSSRDVSDADFLAEGNA